MKEPVPKSARHSYSFGAFRLYATERELFRGSKPVTLPPKTCDTLLLLLRRHGHVVDKNELIRTLWPDTFVEEDNLVRRCRTCGRRRGRGRTEGLTSRLLRGGVIVLPR